MQCEHPLGIQTLTGTAVLLLLSTIFTLDMSPMSRNSDDSVHTTGQTGVLLRSRP